MPAVSSHEGPANAPHEPPGATALADLGDDRDDGERISVTDVNGTVARFEMAYSPPKEGKVVFGPPFGQVLPSLLFLVFALAMVAFVAVVEAGPSGSRFYAFIVEGDRGRPLSARVLSYIVAASAIGTVLRARMRGVIVRADGLEARYLLAMGIPKIKRWAWSQIERVVIGEGDVMLELWNGQYERLPRVRAPGELGRMLESICAARRIRVTKLPPVAGAVRAQP